MYTPLPPSFPPDPTGRAPQCSRAALADHRLPSAVNRNIASPDLCYCCWQIPQGSPCDHRRHLGNSKTSDLTESSVPEQTYICNRCDLPRNFGHVENLLVVCFHSLGQRAPFRFCSRHIVQGLTRICISARLACYCQEGAKHKSKESRWASKKWTVVETHFPCFHFGFLITLPS